MNARLVIAVLNLFINIQIILQENVSIVAVKQHGLSRLQRSSLKELAGTSLTMLEKVPRNHLAAAKTKQAQRRSHPLHRLLKLLKLNPPRPTHQPHEGLQAFVLIRKKELRRLIGALLATLWWIWILFVATIAASS